MSDARCSRTWEVQAARDGRLGEAELAAHHSHAERCATCQREQVALEAYFDSMARVGTEVDRLKLRRLRHTVLTGVSNHAAGSRPRLRAWSYAVLVILACTALVAIIRSDSRSKETIAVAPQANARWQRTRLAHVEQITLSEGTLRLRVTHQPGARQLVVLVPDGEIEDIGTTFRVTVGRGRTTSIAVSEGSVVFRRRGAPDLRLVAGSEWSPLPEVSQIPPARSALGAPSDTGLPATPRSYQVGSQRDLAASQDAGVPEASPARRIAAPPREDEAYLRVIRLVRRGRRVEAKDAAELYLQSFPAGFRRPEVHRLVQELTEQDAAVGP